MGKKMIIKANTKNKLKKTQNDVTRQQNEEMNRIKLKEYRDKLNSTMQGYRPFMSDMTDDVIEPVFKKRQNKNRKGWGE